MLWERLDRIVTPRFAEQNFLDLMDVIESHLAMVFHRYLEGVIPRLRLTINTRRVLPWDPFLISHPATWSSPVVRLPSLSGEVEVQCHVLPHKDRLGLNEAVDAGGPNGWTGQQGFYVYRNRRLLVSGSWLGLGHTKAWTKEEAHRLARIRLDIPNSGDVAWKIDIKKSTATPPVSLRFALRKLAEDTRSRARRVFAHRGKPILLGETRAVIQAWRVEHFSGGMRYRIDETHPAVQTTLDAVGDLAPQVKAMLRVIEETVPVQRIWLDTTEGRETPRTGFAGEPSDEVSTVLMVMYRNLVIRKGVAPDLARDQLLHMEPFHNFPELVAALPDDPDTGV